jgi:hypothetical protein
MVAPRKLTSRERNLLTSGGLAGPSGSPVGTDERDPLDEGDEPDARPEEAELDQGGFDRGGLDQDELGRDDGLPATFAVPVVDRPAVRPPSPDTTSAPEVTPLPDVGDDLPTTAAVPVLPDLPFVGSPLREEPAVAVPVVPAGVPGGVAAEPTPGVPVPVPVPVRTRRRRPRVRKVTRIVRYVDAWSVFKIALFVNIILGIVMLTASVLLWNLAHTTDVVDNIEGVIADWFAYETFTLDGQALFRAVQVLTLLFVLAGTGLWVLAAVLFNLISDLTGGVRLTVLEQEVVAQRAPVPGPPSSGAPVPGSAPTPVPRSSPAPVRVRMNRPPSRRQRV